MNPKWSFCSVLDECTYCMILTLFSSQPNTSINESAKFGAYLYRYPLKHVTSASLIREFSLILIKLPVSHSIPLVIFSSPQLFNLSNYGGILKLVTSTSQIKGDFFSQLLKFCVSLSLS